MSEVPERVLYEREAGLALITLNRPDRLNALSGPVMDQLLAYVQAAADDRSVRAVLLRGAGRAFCAGGDMKSGSGNREELAQMTPEDRTAQLRRRMEAANLMHAMPKPTVSALRGAVMGAGVGLGLSADFRIASTTLNINTAFTALGFSGDYGGAYFLTRLAGVSAARELMMRSRKVGADEALKLGLVTRLVADEELDEAALNLARELAAGPGVAFQHMKRALNAAADGASCAQVLDLEAAAMVRTAETADHKEAVRAFVDKRKPDFSGR
ncbi:MAG: enoyl-CoA hydratase [Hydrocarboniphaga sp.]|uniref:enoyl-CoA hydratase-related protein n=1 Tax=Hydrocarboniphaga sp. TaxID=2033016 RepID=UPI00263815F8|nr:enoyl-CoA hydratase-related protein [Hydrocarboniphaga sp.]MDB5969917.1 enoyl-CoA hydratase [Hydrocarboniphaga sp.]